MKFYPGLTHVSVSINSTSEEVRRGMFPTLEEHREVSINSTSEEVRSRCVVVKPKPHRNRFPLIQLPRKSEAPLLMPWSINGTLFPLIQLPRKSEEALCALFFS